MKTLDDSTPDSSTSEPLDEYLIEEPRLISLTGKNMEETEILYQRFLKRMRIEENALMSAPKVQIKTSVWSNIQGALSKLYMEHRRDSQKRTLNAAHFNIR